MNYYRFSVAIAKHLTRFYSSSAKTTINKMQLKSCTELLNLPKEEVKTWLSTFDTVLTDCDGVLWIQTDAIPGSPNVINKFKEMGKDVFFITNNSTKTRSEFCEKAVQLGFNMSEEGIISTAYLAAQYLKNKKYDKKVYVIGSKGITQELEAVGISYTGTGPDVLDTLYKLANGDFTPDPNINAVIVGFDEHFSFPKMYKAATYLDQPGCIFIGTNSDERFPTTNGIIPGTGSILKSIEVCAGRKCTLMGKPNPYVCEALMTANSSIKPARTLMIGDRCNTDILLGTNCGFQTLLVGTGIHNLADVDEWKKNSNDEDKKLVPDFYLPKLGDLLELMK